MNFFNVIFAIFAFCNVAESAVMRKKAALLPGNETKKLAMEEEGALMPKQNAQLGAMNISVSALFTSAFMKNMLEASNLKEGQRTGNHEAGHAGACAMNPHCTRIVYMTTIADPRTKSRGRTDFETREKYTRNQFEAFLEMFLGGPMCEGVLTGPINLDGLVSDINQAYNITCLLFQNFENSADPNLAIKWTTPCTMNAETKDKAGVYLTELAERMLPKFERESNKKVLQELADRVTEKKFLKEDEIYTYLNRLH